MLDCCALIDLQRYAVLVERLLSQRVTLWLVDGGKLVNEGGFAISEAADLLTQLTQGERLWWQRAEPWLSEALGDGHNHKQLFTMPLHNHLGEISAQFAVVLEQPVDEPGWLATPLKVVAECLSAELNLNAELDEMAAELTARYEELNLVFDTSDEVGDFSATRQCLQKLVDNCHSYMEVGLCGLVLRGQRMSFSSVGNSVSPGDAQAAMSKFGSSLADWIYARGETLVINDIDDPRALAACAGLPYKITAVPVMGRAQRSLGVLVVAKPYSANDFTNSDRNLLEVMARKTAKIVQSSFDELTGLVGRAGFEQCLEEARIDALDRNAEHAVLLLDIDRMQVVNDNFGIAGGDLAICEVAEILRSEAREDDLVARLEGDEFGVVLRNCPGDVARGVAQKFLDRIRNTRVQLGSDSFELSTSFGVCPVDCSSTSLASILGAVEVAQSLAKDQGGQQVCVFAPGDNEVSRRQGHMQMVGNIQDALRHNRFELYAQPIVPLVGKGSIHAEILLRLRGQDNELISPAAFLPAAERYHLMPAIDRWVIGETLRQLDASGVLAQRPELVFTVNLTGQSLSDSTFANFVGHCLDKYDLPPGSLCFEITETTAIGDLVRAQEFIAAMRKRKILFALDDFGTGLSSFSYLKQLDLDYLKIDGGFVKDICKDSVAETMVRAINEVAQSMGLATVGEFVMDEAIRNKLQQMGVDYGQGFALAKPEPLAEVIAGFAEFSPLLSSTGGTDD